MKKNFFYFQIFVFLITLISCVSTKNISKQETINDFVEYSYHNENGIVYHCTKIDLSKDFEIVAYPNQKEKQKRIRINDFIQKTDAKIAINTSPYAKNGEILGIHIENGIKHSKSIQKYSALFFEKDENGFKANLSVNQKDEDFENAIFAFGGFFTILKDGEIQTFKHTSFRPRTAVGISKNGKTIFLLTVEKGLKKGLSYPECAEILKKIGSENALQFDGGNSTSLFLEGKVKFRESLRKNSAYFGIKY